MTFRFDGGKAFTERWSINRKWGVIYAPPNSAASGALLPVSAFIEPKRSLRPDNEVFLSHIGFDKNFRRPIDGYLESDIKFVLLKSQTPANAKCRQRVLSAPTHVMEEAKMAIYRTYQIGSRRQRLRSISSEASREQGHCISG